MPRHAMRHAVAAVDDDAIVFAAFAIIDAAAIC